MEPPEDLKIQGVVLKNLTARKISIPGTEISDGFDLPPFAQRAMPGEAAVAMKAQLDPLELKNQVKVQETRRPENENVLLALGCLVWIAVIGIVVGLLVGGLRSSFYYWFGGGALLIGGFLALIMRLNRRRVSRGLLQALSLATILAVGAGLPLVTILFFGEGARLLEPGWSDDPSHSLALLGRGLQLLLIATFSLIPALLYFLFDRYRLGTLREKFFREVILLDPNVTNLEDARSTYGQRVDEVYGAESDEDEEQRGNKFLTGTRWPILLATVVITAGWLLVWTPIGPVPEAVRTPAGFDSLFLPRLTAPAFGFLGAYFFTITMLFRRYVRGDLRPKAYSHVTVRIIVVLILVWVVSLGFRSGHPLPLALTLPAPQDGESDAAEAAAEDAQEQEPEEPADAPADSDLLLVLAFLIGVVPDTGIALIVSGLKSKRALGRFMPQLLEEHPLTKLEGMNLYDRARLLEEGIENVENMAHCDVIDVMLQTRIPVQRIVDAVDQSILYLHLSHVPAPAGAQAESDGSMPYGMRLLRGYGIRTATDLIRAFEEACTRDKKASRRGDAAEAPKLLGLLDPDDAKVKRVRVVLDAMVDDEWLVKIRHWRDLRLHGARP